MSVAHPVVPSTKINIIPPENRAIPWFEDGNIILMTHDFAFKVYKGMISQHSPVLKEMMETGATEVIEGCPAVHMDDSTTDLSHFLAVIHGCESHRPFQLKSKLDFLTLVGVLRIATKYKADQLRKRALLPLQLIYPTRLSQWDESFEARSMMWELDPVTVINLARELDALSLLPGAMAFLANSTLADEAFSASIFQTQPLRFVPGLRSAEDVKMFALAREYQHGAIARTLRYIREQGKDRQVVCQRGDGCASRFTGMFVALAVMAATSEAPEGYPNFVLTVQGLLAREDLCGSCRDRVEVGLDRKRRVWWRGLPEALGFSGWDDARLR